MNFSWFDEGKDFAMTEEVTQRSSSKYLKNTHKEHEKCDRLLLQNAIIQKQSAVDHRIKQILDISDQVD